MRLLYEEVVAYTESHDMFCFLVPLCPAVRCIECVVWQAYNVHKTVCAILHAAETRTLEREPHRSCTMYLRGEVFDVIGCKHGTAPAVHHVEGVK